MQCLFGLARGTIGTVKAFMSNNVDSIAIVAVLFSFK